MVYEKNGGRRDMNGGREGHYPVNHIENDSAFNCGFNPFPLPCLRAVSREGGRGMIGQKKFTHTLSETHMYMYMYIRT
jgi:hypothetical protein